MITLSKLNKEKRNLVIIKGILMGIVIIFFITLMIFFFLMNFLYLGYLWDSPDICFYIVAFTPFSLLVLAGVFFLIFRLFTARYLSHYLQYIKITHFQNSGIKREHLMELLNITDENFLRKLGFNYTVKEFDYDDFTNIFKVLKKKEKLHRLSKSIKIDEVSFISKIRNIKHKPG